MYKTLNGVGPTNDSIHWFEKHGKYFWAKEILYKNQWETFVFFRFEFCIKSKSDAIYYNAAYVNVEVDKNDEDAKYIELKKPLAMRNDSC